MRTSRLLKERLHYRVIVTLKSGDAFGGVLWAADEQIWVLRDAVLMGRGNNGSNISVDGEVVLVTRDIAYAQKP